MPEVIDQRGAWIMGAGALPPTPSGSGDADVLRASQLLHAVEHVDRPVHLSRPTLIRVRAQPVADHLFPSANGGLGLGALRGPGRFLPGHAPCQAMRPCSAVCWRWRSRCVGSFSAVALGTAVARGGT